jgi:hypothetical protein
MSESQLGGKRRSRRSFIRTIGAVAAGVFLVPLLAATASARRQSPEDPVGSLSSAAYAARIGERFRIRVAPSRTVEVELFKVRESSYPAGARLSPNAPAWEQFSAIFRGPSDRRLPQETYRFEHAELGAFSLFIVPTAPAADGQRYVAAFSRRAA